MAEDNQDSIDVLVIPSKLWLSGGNGLNRRLPTVHIPNIFAQQFHLDKPCKIIFKAMPKQGGILIKYFGDLDSNA